jgi:signal transduction histidine kinase
MAGTTNNERDAAARLDQLERLFNESGPGPTVPREVRTRLRARALELAQTRQGRSDAVALLGFAGELCLAVAVDLATRPADMERLLGQIEAITSIPRVGLGREVLRAPQLPQLSTDVAIEVQLALLLAFSEVRAVSLWTRSPDGDLRHVAHAGDLEPGARREREAAKRVLTGQTAARREAGDAAGVTIDRWRAPAAALIAHGPPRGADHRELLLDAAAPALAAVLERDALLARQSPPEQTMMSAVERRLARLRFDLHDGPQQDVHLLAMDLNLFREQLLPIIAADPNADRLAGRLEDLAAQLVALDGDLRRLSTSVQSPFMPPGSLAETLRQITDAFAARTGIEPQTQLDGDFSILSDSQQIALLALVREALSNVRAHSDARNVKVTIYSHPGGVEAEVVDDGRGFEPESTLVRAARGGHLGLVGMHERMRMLGGQTQIESRPGGPTVISVRLPSWSAGEPPDD